MQQLSGESLDIVNENVTKLKEIFPEVFTEGKIDFEKLEETLGEFIDRDDERYNFTWKGKQNAKKVSQTPSSGTLRPCKEESKEWDNTQNLYIEGDNLEVLKLLQKSYHKQVKMIYIDPPYNTGKEFIYPDNYRDNLDTYLKYTGQTDDEGKKFSTNAETNGRYHTNWLNMMYPRLKLARNLLKDDGVIFISIDDNEVANLRKICDEVFGEDNFICSIMWKRKKEISSDSKNVAIQGEYVLVYSKSNETLFFSEPLSDAYIKKSYKEPTTDYPLGRWRAVPITVSKGLSGGGYIYKITAPNGNIHERLWAYPENSYKDLVDNKRVYFGKDGTAIPQKIIYAHESNGQPSTNYWDNTATNKEGKKEILDLFSENYFDTPKPTSLLIRLIKLICGQDDLIFDFFSGSATTAHAVMKLNSEDNGSRKFIMVQLPEETDEKSEAYKAGYKNICEIGKERIRRSGEKIKEDNKDKDLSTFDTGFKVFKLDSSNIKAWDSDFDNLEASLLDAVENIKEERTSEDLLYEILLKYGLDLTLPIEEKTINNKKVYIIGYGALVVCLDDDITTDTVEQIAKLKEEYQSQVMRVVFKDSSFKDAVVKTNALQTLKQFGIDEVVSV